ncbi:hypothetical protein FDG2_1697 [Candidatus Protofrankia californiensis]|uniref:Uncharacterized protein n=1 Tax=Candidatus Protofrankia californiensis TaxID=1839754 RepID=A0A1C3NW51_9ACTN|nr:hypothetical protein FDG2_1697 [Candidatus Protofrankia californiensis]
MAHVKRLGFRPRDWYGRRVTMRPLREVIGEGVRRVREGAGARQDDVARAARLFGLAWNRSRVGTLERGEKAISAEELALLPHVLERACKRPVTLEDLIPSWERIDLAANAWTTGQQLLDTYASRNKLTLSGQVLLDIAETPVGQSLPDPEAFRAVLDLERQVRDRLWELRVSGYTSGSHNEPGGSEAVARWDRQAGEPERKAAKRLGEHPVVLVGLSHFLWGRTLSEERDRLVDERVGPNVGADTRRALRGRITRHLVDQLGEEIERRSGEKVGEHHEET